MGKSSASLGTETFELLSEVPLLQQHVRLSARQQTLVSGNNLSVLFLGERQFKVNFFFLLSGFFFCKSVSGLLCLELDAKL